MKTIKIIIQFFTNLFNRLKYRRITKKLQNGAKNKNTDRNNLRFLMARFKNKYRRKMIGKNSSKYIPWTFEEKQCIKLLCEKEFGNQMKQLNVRLNNNLELI